MMNPATPTTRTNPSSPAGSSGRQEAELLVGGQALLEGVMMRSPGAWGVAVRRPDGTLALDKGTVRSWAARYPVLKLPLLRGVGVLFQSLVIGLKALNFSASVAVAAAGAEGTAAEPGEERQGGSEARARDAQPAGSAEPADIAERAPSKPGAGQRGRQGGDDASSWAIAGSLAIGAGVGAAVFLFLPLWLTQLSERHLFGSLSNLSFNLLDGGLRALFFLVYLFAISRLPDIHRVFMYHGAEHKVVFAYERKLPLTVTNAREQSRLHPRCGTSFLLFVLLVSIVVFAVIPKAAPFLIKLGGRLVLVPLVAGLSYEVLRLTARKRAAPLFSLMVFPGLMLQKITTQEPTDDMLEVAIIALEEALREDGLLPAPGTPLAADREGSLPLPDAAAAPAPAAALADTSGLAAAARA